MSINIDEKLLKKALRYGDNDLITTPGVPLMGLLGSGCSLSYDGEFLSLINAAGQYSAIGTGFGSPAYQATRDEYSLLIAAKCFCVTSDANVYIFFMEPRKANYDNFQGFRHDGVNHCFEFRKDGAEEQDNITGQDWTTEHEFQIKHQKSQLLCQGYIDGVMKAESTDSSKISAQPFCLYCCEPNSVARTCKLRLPPGIYFWSG